jgi:hypothetical protein
LGSSYRSFPASGRGPAHFPAIFFDPSHDFIAWVEARDLFALALIRRGVILRAGGGSVGSPGDPGMSKRSAVAVLLVAFLTGPLLARPPREEGPANVQLDVVLAQVTQGKGKTSFVNFLRHSRVGSGIQTVQDQPALFWGVLDTHSGVHSFLQTLELVNLGKLVAVPRLVTLSGRPAIFRVGGEQVVPVPAGLGQVAVQFEEFGTRLNFLPVVLGNGKIRLEVEPEISTRNADAGVSFAGATVVGRTTQRIHTTIELESGQTFVLGGFPQKLKSGGEKGGEIEAEMVVVVTAHVIPRVEEPASHPADSRGGASTAKKESTEMPGLRQAYQRACDEGRPEVARAIAVRMIELDPTCFRHQPAPPPGAQSGDAPEEK